MKIDHKCITSSIFELVKTIETDIDFGDDSWSIRIELFRDTEAINYYRCHVWEMELFRLTPSFPKDDADRPKDITDDIIMVDRGIAHSKIDYKRFKANNDDEAVEIIIDDLKYYLEHVTGEKPL